MIAANAAFRITGTSDDRSRRVRDSSSAVLLFLLFFFFLVLVVRLVAPNHDHPGNNHRVLLIGG
jgi:hypothetical protein